MRYIVKNVVIFPMFERERMLFMKRQLQATKWKKKINRRTIGGVPSQIRPFAGVKIMLRILCKFVQR